jgi:hypothetical protein
MEKLRFLSPAATQNFQALYERHYGVILPVSEAEQKLTALLGLLTAAREGASHGCPGAAQRYSLGHREVTR